MDVFLLCCFCDACVAAFAPIVKWMIKGIRGYITMNQDTNLHARTAPKERIQLDCSPETITRLDELTGHIGAQTRADTVRQALRLLAWMVEEVPEESTIQVLDPHGEQRSTIEAAFLRFAIHPAPCQERPPQEEAALLDK